MKDYSQGKIYKLYSVSNEYLVYYGSTIQTLSRRLSLHIYDYKKNNGCTSKKVIATGDYKIELIENYPCNSKAELDRREGEFTKNNVCVNKLIAGRTRKEWSEDNKEYQKEYRKKNKEKIKERNKEWHENNKEYKKEYTKQYKENNKEKIVERSKKYRENNKEKILEYKKIKVTCECGCIILKNDLAKHKRTNKHLELMKD